MNIVDTFNVDIYAGLRPSYHDTIEVDWSVKRKVVRDICQTFCDKQGLCVTLTNTEFVYTDGSEQGVIVGLINYPRFPKSKQFIMEQANKITILLMRALDQERMSIVTTDKTIMLEKTDLCDHRGN